MAKIMTIQSVSCSQKYREKMIKSIRNDVLHGKTSQPGLVAINIQVTVHRTVLVIFFGRLRCRFYPENFL